MWERPCSRRRRSRRNGDTEVPSNILNRAVRLATLCQISLMILFGPPKFRRRLDLGHNRSIEFSARGKFLLGSFRARFLFGRIIKNHRSILRPNIRALAVHRRRVVVRPENIEELVVTDLSWIKLELDNFGVAGFVATDILIAGIVLVAAGIPHRGRGHPLQIAKRFFHTPETPGSKHRVLCRHWKRSNVPEPGATTVALAFGAAANNMLEMSSRTTIDDTNAPLVIRLLNRCGSAIEKAGLKSKPLSAARLINTAKRRSQLHDFGEPDFFEPLSRLLESCHREARLNVIGKLALKNDVVRILSNRLFLERDRQLDPEIAKQEIREPLFIVGLPRSGTTLLHTLLAADPAHRVPLTWEVMSPSPATAEDRQRRIRSADRDLAMLRWLAPTFESVHATGAELPQECVSLMSPTFMSDQFDTMYNIPSYRTWFFQQDLRPAYDYHRRFLQHLQRRRSAERWVLKAPAHMFAAPALMATYPDAKFVQLHRDPIDAVASVSSLVTILRRVFSDIVDPIQIGRDAMIYWSDAVKTFMSVRDNLSPQRVCDLYYEDVRRDPISVAKRIYKHFDWKLEPAVEQRMGVILAEQNSRGNGVHRYNADYFELSGTNGFAEYCDRFGFTASMALRSTERAEAAA